MLEQDGTTVLGPYSWIVQLNPTTWSYNSIAEWFAFSDP